eukprot:Partr_v1_DN28080_c0_g1_i3_m57405 putative potassium channel, subfamily T, member
MFCIIYLVEVEFDNREAPVFWQALRPVALEQMLAGLSVYALISVFSHLLLHGHRIREMLRVKFFIEIITTVPFFVSLAIGQSIYAPYFLRSYLLKVRLKKVMQMQSEYRLFNIRLSKVTETLLQLAASLLAIIYSAMCAFQYCENMFGDERVDLDMMSCFYFIVVTVSTVGYGDLSPKSLPGRAVIVLLIFIMLSTLPSLIGEIVDALNAKRLGGDTFTNNSQEHVIICSMGKFHDQQILDLLRQLLHEEMQVEYRVVLFTKYELLPSVSEFMKMPNNEDHVSYVRGVVKHSDMQRAGFEKASACFILTGDPAEQGIPDLDNILHVWTIRNFRPNLPIYIYTRSADAEKFISPLTSQVICLDEVKHMLLSYDCIYEGSSTLITNLMIQSGVINDLKQTWQHQYSDGFGNELYKVDVPNCLVNIPFGKAAAFLYYEFQIIGIAVECGVEGKLRLNPGNDHILSRADSIICIAESPEELEDMSTYSRQDVEDFFIKQHQPIENVSYDASLHPRTASRQMDQGIIAKHAEPPYELSDEQEGQLCIILENPASVESARLEKATMKDHIIICSASFD